MRFAGSQSICDKNLSQTLSLSYLSELLSELSLGPHQLLALHSGLLEVVHPGLAGGLAALEVHSRLVPRGLRQLQRPLGLLVRVPLLLDQPLALHQLRLLGVQRRLNAALVLERVAVRLVKSLVPRLERRQLLRVRALLRLVALRLLLQEPHLARQQPHLLLARLQPVCSDDILVL